MARRMSRAEAEVQARLTQAEPNSDRHHILEAAASFRASWVGLGERLTWVRETQAFSGWGYPSFEGYCRRELNLKSDTANKLTRSFSFLRDHQARSPESETPQATPPLDVVDLLSQARERTALTEERLHEISAEALQGSVPPTRHEVLKQLRDVDPEAFRAPAKTPSVATGTSVDLRKALLLAERLAGLLDAQDASVFGDASREAAKIARLLGEQVGRPAEAPSDLPAAPVDATIN